MMSNGAKRRVLGIWDLNILPLHLGGLLILIEEMQAQCIINKINLADMCIIGDLSTLKCSNEVFIKEDSAILLDEESSAFSPYLSMVGHMEGVDKCYMSFTLKGAKNFIDPKLYYTWPLFKRQEYVYGSTQNMKKFFREHGFIPHLVCKEHTLKWAVNFIKGHVDSLIPIVVHLKNNPAHPTNMSNANFDIWLNFFKSCYRNYDAMFILIGNEKIDDRIASLPNVLISRNFGGNLPKDLALIQTAFAFMGMASGPSTMAIFGNVPYAIFKNPVHHAREMSSELGVSTRFPFAGPLQKILRIYETEENLMEEFLYFYNNINRQDWIRRLTG